MVQNIKDEDDKANFIARARSELDLLRLRIESLMARPKDKDNEEMIANMREQVTELEYEIDNPDSISDFGDKASNILKEIDELKTAVSSFEANTA